MKTKRDLISTIKIDRANLSYIEKTGVINGTLLIEIERIMEEYRSQPLPEQTESAELTDLKQYVTNLLYFAHSVSSDDFDAWVEEQTNNLDQYFQSHPEAREIPSDEEIDRKYPINLNPHTLSEIDLNNESINKRAGAKWFKSQIK